MSFNVNTEAGRTVVTIEEARLDAASAEQFKTFLFEQIDGGGSRMVVDLSEVRFMDSSGLGTLVSALKKIGDSGQLVLAAAQPAVLDLFNLTSMDRLFTILPSVAEALEEK